MESSSSLRSRQRAKIEERNKLYDRKNMTDALIMTIDMSYSEAARLVNMNIFSCIIYYSSGLTGGKESILTDINSQIEKLVYDDPSIKSCIENLQSESRRCQNRIDILDAEISLLETQIRVAEYEEEQEREKRRRAALQGGHLNG